MERKIWVIDATGRKPRWHHGAPYPGAVAADYMPGQRQAPGPSIREALQGSGRTCAVCGQPIDGLRASARTCSRICRQKLYLHHTKSV